MPYKSPRGWTLFRWIGLVLGVGLFVWLLLRADLPAVWSLLQQVRWRFLMVLGFYAVIFGLDTLGWKFTLRPSIQRRVPWDRLFRARLAGEAVNYVTPAAWIGGEPVKAALLSKWHGVPMSEGVASVVVAKTTFVLSMLLFAGVGLVVTLATQPLSASLIRWVWIVFPVLAFLLGMFLWVQFLQPFRFSASVLGRFAPAWLGRIQTAVHGWDEAVVSFYREAPGAVLWSIGFHFLGWLAGAVEVFLILYFLNVPISFSTALSIEALWVLLRSGAFLIPASLGASEGIGLLVCGGLGVSAVPGLALGLIRRARELAWVGIGLMEFVRKD